MKKNFLLMVLFAWMGTSAMAQDGKLLSNPALQEIAVLKDLAKQITIAETNVATASRSTAATAQAEVKALYASYEKELANQKTIHATDKKIVAAIAEEQKLVTSKK